jgi:hypothetical protein
VTLLNRPTNLRTVEREAHLDTLRRAIAENELCLARMKLLLTELESRRVTTDTQVRDRSARQVKRQSSGSKN